MPVLPHMATRRRLCSDISSFPRIWSQFELLVKKETSACELASFFYTSVRIGAFPALGVFTVWLWVLAVAFQGIVNFEQITVQRLCNSGFSYL